MLAQTVNTLIRLLQKEQSDQGIHCLSFMKLLREVYITRSHIYDNLQHKYGISSGSPNIQGKYGITNYMYTSSIRTTWQLNISLSTHQQTSEKLGTKNLYVLETIRRNLLKI